MDRARDLPPRPHHQERDRDHQDFRQGDIRDSLADIFKAKSLLGYDPKIDFNLGIKETVVKFLGRYANS